MRDNHSEVDYTNVAVYGVLKTYSESHLHLSVLESIVDFPHFLK